MTLRTAFFGTPDVAAEVLDGLVDDARLAVTLVITNPDRPRGRHKTPQPSPVKRRADQHGIPVLQPQRPTSITDALRDAQLDVIAVVAYGAILPVAVLETSRLGAVNLHFSLLPRWRGAAPVQHAIRHGDTQTGVTSFLLDEGMDTGPIIAQQSCPIADDDTAGDVLARLTELGKPQLADALVQLATGAPLTPQDDALATYAPKITPDDVRVAWTTQAGTVVNLVRSANPVPGAHTTFRGERAKIWVARRGSPQIAAPGEVVATAPELTVAASDGTVIIDSIQPSGRSRMRGIDFVNGRRVQPGEVFGA